MFAESIVRFMGLPLGCGVTQRKVRRAPRAVGALSLVTEWGSHNERIVFEGAPAQLLDNEGVRREWLKL